MAGITGVSLGRGRAGEQVTITGYGFGPAPADNEVTIDDELCLIVSATETQVVVTVPAGIDTDQWVTLKVQRTDFQGQFAVRVWWSKAALAAMQAMRVPGQQPGSGEVPGVFLPSVALAQDVERIAANVELFARDLLSAKGSIFARDATGPTERTVGAAGQALESLAADATGMAYAAASGATPPRRAELPWGGRIATGTAGLQLLNANGRSDELVNSPSSVHGVPFAGTVTQAWVAYLSGAQLLDQVQILTSAGVGSPLFTASGLGIAAPGVYVGSPAAGVSVPDLLQIRVATNVITTGDTLFLAGLVVV